MKSITIIISGLAIANAASVPKYKRAGTLSPWKFEPLPLGTIKPSGWLHADATAMSNGMAGRLAEFYDIIVDSAWFKDPVANPYDYSNLMEALPYWFNGIVPLAYELDDDRLKAQANSAADKILDKQAEDGWIGPETEGTRNFWGRMPLFLGLANLADVNADYTDRIVDSLKRFFRLTNTMLKNDGEGYTNCSEGYDCTWGQVRVGEMLVTMQWLLEKHPSEDDDLIWETMEMFHDMNTLKWEDWYTDAYPHTVPNPDPGNLKLWPFIHGVNVGQGLKYFAVVSRYTNDASFLSRAADAVSWTFQYYGTASGSVIGDEAEKDLAPYHGTELCTVAETIYSLAYLYQATGDSTYADRAERAVYNAYPVQMSGNKIGHQYISEQNQIHATRLNVSSPYVNAKSPLASTFGLEPSYKCCTVNHGQGLPKFISNAWTRAGDSGLAHVLLGGVDVATQVNGGNVDVKVDTNYPFSNILTYSVQSDVDFDFYVRVPGWYVPDSSGIQVGDGEASSLSPDPTSGLHKISLTTGTTKITYKLGAEIRSEQRPSGAIAIYHGAIHYALDIGHSGWDTLPHMVGGDMSEMNWLPDWVRDYFYDSTKEWNVAVDPSTWSYAGLEDEGAALPDPLFEPYAPPTSITVQGCTVDWDTLDEEFVDWAPQNPVCRGEKKEYKLLPLGGAKMHMSDLPVVKF